jgi:cell division protein FtsQ
MPQSIDKKKIVIYLTLLIILSSISNKTFQNNERDFAKIKSIDINGVSNSNKKKLVNEFNQLISTNIFFINKELISKTIEKNNFIESYTVKKIYPSKLYMEIKSAKFIAKIYKNDTKYFIGSNGKLINNKVSKAEIPIFLGKFNSIDFLNFKENIEKSKFNFFDFKSINLLKSNRWDIVTKNNRLIKLPENNLIQALEIAHKIIKDEKLKVNKIIDLRVHNRIILKNE